MVLIPINLPVKQKNFFFFCTLSPRTISIFIFSERCGIARSVANSLLCGRHRGATSVRSMAQEEPRASTPVTFVRRALRGPRAFESTCKVFTGWALVFSVSCVGGVSPPLLPCAGTWQEELASKYNYFWSNQHIAQIASPL